MSTALATVDFLDASLREVTNPSASSHSKTAPPDAHYRIEDGWIKLYDQGTRSYRPIESDQGAVITVEDA